MLISAVIITMLEFVTGIIINRWFNWGIWDYSRVPYNFLGQVCLLFSNLWFFLSLPAILLDDFIRYRFLLEEKPRYKLF